MSLDESRQVASANHWPPATVSSSCSNCVWLQLDETVGRGANMRRNKEEAEANDVVQPKSLTTQTSFERAATDETASEITPTSTSAQGSSAEGPAKRKAGRPSTQASVAIEAERQAKRASALLANPPQRRSARNNPSEVEGRCDVARRITASCICTCNLHQQITGRQLQSHRAVATVCG